MSRKFSKREAMQEIENGVEDALLLIKRGLKNAVGCFLCEADEEIAKYKDTARLAREEAD